MNKHIEKALNIINNSQEKWFIEDINKAIIVNCLLEYTKETTLDKGLNRKYLRYCESIMRYSVGELEEYIRTLGEE